MRCVRLSPYTTCGPLSLALWCGHEFFWVDFQVRLECECFFEWGFLFCFVLFRSAPPPRFVKRGAWEEAYHERREVISWETEDLG